MKKIADIGEFGLIGEIRRSFLQKDKNIAKGIGDDCAVIRQGKDKFMLLTTDTMAQDTHFSLKWRVKDLFFKLGKKAIYTNISDIAAMGGRPAYALVTAGVPKGFKLDHARRLISGIKAASQEFGTAVVGGDLVSSRHLFITIALAGFCSRFYTRDGAKTGDNIYVTGSLGESAEGLKLLNAGIGKKERFLNDGKNKIERHLLPKPRLNESLYLSKQIKISSMIDISDGLLQDLSHILEESRKGAEICVSLVPGVKDAGLRLAGGEDYEILFTTPDTVSRRRLADFSRRFRIRLNYIGKIIKGNGLHIIRNGKRTRLKPPFGFDHFK